MTSNVLNTLGSGIAATVAKAPTACLVLICIAVYARALSGDFVMDDWPVIKENSKISQTGEIANYFTSGVWDNTDFAEQTNFKDRHLYRPLFLLTLHGAYKLWQDEPAGYHALNITLHCIATVLVFYLILGLLPNSPVTPALFGAAFFAAHPVHVESIAWIAGLTDPLVAICLLASFQLYRRSLAKESAPSAVLALTFFGAGLLSKEIAIAFPALLVIHDWLQERIRAKRYAPYLVVLALYFVARSSALGQGIEWQSFDLAKFPVLLEFLLRYVQLLIVPWPLEYYYARPQSGILAIAVGAIGALLMLAFLPYWLRKRNSVAVLAIAWFALTLLPALPIALMEKSVFAIRVLYLPSVGAALLAAVAYGAVQLHPQWKMSAWLVPLLFALISIDEISDWKDDLTFYTLASASNPRSSGAFNGLARALEREGNYQEAVSTFLKAAELSPDNDEFLVNLESAARNLGQRGLTRESEQYYKQILELDPQRSSAWVGLGNNALARQDTRQALEFYHKAFAADPDNYVASYNLAMLYRRLGDSERSTHFERIAQQIAAR